MARELLQAGSVLCLQETEYTIESVCGAGSNAVVYRAVYRDNLNTDKLHRVLIKELFPLDPSGTVYRDASGDIHYDGAEELFELHRESFLHGNDAHLQLLLSEADSVGGNINSYAAHNTYYTILPFHSTSTLEQRMKSFVSLSEKLSVICGLLDALHCFHRSGMLHLDVSPDNVLLLERENSIYRRRSVLLIDYNSVWNMEELSGHEGIYFSVKAHYTPPEVRLRDRRSIGTHSDLFSVAAILYEMVTGRKTETDDLYGGLRGEAGKAVDEAMQGQAQSVVHKLRRILRKGLDIVPGRRYTSCEEMLADIEDLRSRIDRRGVTASSLWECACARLKSRKNLYKDTDILPNDVTAGDGTHHDALQYLQNACESGTDVWIYGDGGFGKTTLLYRLAYDKMRKFKENAPVLHYISLSGYNDPDNPNYIRDSLTVGIRADDSTRTVEDTRRALDALLQSDSVRVIVMLDGFNELHTDPAALVREIRALQQYDAVQFICTARSDERERYGLQALQAAQLCALSTQSVESFLQTRALQIPQPSVFSLLSNPLMLQMYVRSMQIRRDTGEVGSTSLYAPQDGESLIRGFLESLLLAEEQHRAGDTAAVAQVRYVLQFFLPLLAYRADAKHGMMTKEELLSFSEENYALLQSRVFSYAFPDYAGKSRDILAGVRTGAEWFDLSVREILTKRFRLLYVQDDAYRLSHDYLQSVLAADGAALIGGFRKYKRIRRLPKIAAVVAAVLAIVLAAGIVITQKVLPDKSAQIADNARAAFEAGDYYAAGKSAAESVQLLVRPSETDPGVAQLRSILTDKALRDTLAVPHKEYTIRFPSPYAAYYGTSADQTKVVFGNTTDYWVCDNRTGEILETLTLNTMGDLFAEYPEQDDPDEVRSISMERCTFDIPIEGIAEYSEDDSVLRLIGSDGQTIWTVKGSGKPLYTISVDGSAAAAICDGKFLVRVFDGSADQIITAPLGYTFRYIYLSAHGRFLFAMGSLKALENDSDDYLFVFDTVTGQRIGSRITCNADSPISCGAAFPLIDEPAFYVFEDDRGTMTKYVYREEAPAEKQRYSLLTENIWQTNLSPDGKIAFSYARMYETGKPSSDTFLFFDPDTGKTIRSFTFDDKYEPNRYYSVSEDLRYFALYHNSTVFLYDIFRKDPVFTYTFFRSDIVRQSAWREEDEPTDVRSIWVSTDGGYVACELSNSEIHCFSKADEYAHRRIELPEEVSEIWDVGFNDGCIYIGVSGSGLDGNENYCSVTLVYSTDDLKQVGTIPLALYGMENIVSGAQRYFCGKYLLTYHEPDDVVHIYDLADKTEIGHDYAIQDCALDPNGKLLAMREIYGQMQGSTEIRVLRITPDHTLEILYSYNPGRESEYCFAEDGKYLVVVTDEGSAVLDAETGKEVLNLPGAQIILQNGAVCQLNAVDQFPCALPRTALPSVTELLPQAQKVFS